jgi:hypothetical protein
MAKRKSIPEAVKLRLWTEAGGRCQFKGCNKRLWEHEVSLSDGNFAEMAHIIGARESGPRGNKLSLLLQTDIENLMLLCPECHKLVDGDTPRYTVELLKEWKRDHENRIEIQTSLTPDQHRTTILTFTAKIGERVPQITDTATYNSIFPKFPTHKRAFRLEYPYFDRTNPLEWNSTAEEIEKRIRSLKQDGYEGKPVEHVSIFGIGPMPLLMYMGKCIGDTVSADLYQAHRDISDNQKNWTWKNGPVSLPFQVKTRFDNKSTTTVAVLLSISDHIHDDKLGQEINESCAVYEIGIPEPGVHAISHPQQVEAFSKVFRKLLSDIQAHHGVDCEVHLLPAIPVSLAIECGRVLLPTKDPVIWVWEFDQATKVFQKVLKLL